MKRSVVNRHIREFKEFLAGMRFTLPPFAYWSPGDWESKGREYDEIRDNLLGWDITDFGRDDFDKFGFFLFTIRNGNVRVPSGKPYAEKILIVKPGQKTPNHFHKSKMEDIINRGGGGDLKIRLYRSIDARTPDMKSDVPISVDGRNYTVKAGTVVTLEAGESITLYQGVFHHFWSDETMLLLGEVSMVNDDHNDNFFEEELGRFPAIEEDEKPLHLLVGDYKKLT
jgi:D-lyxose ketol-isomerase